MKPADVHFYVDADILGLGKVLASLRSDVTYPGDPGATIHKRQRPPCDISPGAKDPVGIPQVAAAGWLVITRDRHIQHHTAEIDAVMESGARLVALTSDDAATTWGQLEVVMNRWRDIEGLVGLPGPFVYRATRTVLAKVA